jgi:Protein of unknown function (DUF1194)
MKTPPRPGLKGFLFLGALGLLWPGAASAVENVDLKLVLATDVSGSISNAELRIERQGTAAAFVDPDVIKAIENGALGRIAVAMLDFSSPGFGKTVVDWRIIHDRESAVAFARAVVAVPRTPGNRTSISNAIELGAELIEASEKDIVATRKVIDVAGDGPNNDGKPVRPILQKVMAQGVIVNGLPIMDPTANGFFLDLDKYYQACVAGGRGSFVIAVRSFRDFGSAMRRKLILEISQNESDTKLAQGSGEKSPVQPIALALPEQLTVLRPGRNEFSNDCNMRDAP